MVEVPSCVTRHTIQRLNEMQHPRLIYIIVPDFAACHHHLQGVAPNVRCVDESTVIPSVNKQYVTDMLTKTYPGLQDKERRRAGWYLQQVPYRH
jgi:hypothetical protein